MKTLHRVADQDWLRWLPVFGLVVVLHLLVWWAYTHFKDEIMPPKPLSVVQVSILGTPPEPHVAPPQPPVKVEPRLLNKAMPTQNPVPVNQPVVEHAVQQAAVAQPASPAPAPVQPVAESPLELPRYNAAYLSNPPPAYPLSARRRGIEGTTLVRAEIAADGECLRAELKKSSGAEALDQAALEAVKKWRFVPAKRGAQAVVAWVEVPITFKLENN